MQTVKLRGYFLPMHNPDVENAPKKIHILLSEKENIDKIKRCAKNLAGDNAKIPVKNKVLCATVNTTVLCYGEEGVASSFKDIIGNEVTVTIQLKRYSFKSKYEKNLGEKITGVRALLSAIWLL
jgi:hypothetical protein